MGTQITPTGIKFPEHDKEQTAPVVSVNSTAPDADGNIEVAAGGGATYVSQDYHATTDFLFKDSKWYGEHMVYSYSTNASAIENLSVGSVLHEVGSDLSFSVVFIDADANRITLNRGDFVDLGTSNKTLEDRENSTFGSTTFTYVSGTGNSMNCTNIWLQVIGNQNNANTESLPTSNNSVANLPMKLDHLPSMATHIIFRVSSETGGSFKIYNRETFNVRPPTAELLPSEIVHQIDIEGSGTQSGFSEFRVPVNSYFRFWVTGGAKANLYPVGYSVLDLSEIDLQSASNPVITALETRVNTLEGSSGVTTVNGQTGDVTVSGFDGNYSSLDNKPTIPTDLIHLTDNSELLSSGGSGEGFSSGQYFYSEDPDLPKSQYQQIYAENKDITVPESWTGFRYFDTSTGQWNSLLDNVLDGYPLDDNNQLISLTTGSYGYEGTITQSYPTSMTSIGSDIYILANTLISTVTDSGQSNGWLAAVHKYDTVNDTWTYLGAVNPNSNIGHYLKASSIEQFHKSTKLIAVNEHLYLISLGLTTSSLTDFQISKWNPNSSTEPFSQNSNIVWRLNAPIASPSSADGVIDYFNVCTDGVDSIFIAGGVNSSDAPSDKFVLRFDISFNSIIPIGESPNLYGFDMFTRGGDLIINGGRDSSGNFNDKFYIMRNVVPSGSTNSELIRKKQHIIQIVLQVNISAGYSQNATIFEQEMQAAYNTVNMGDVWTRDDNIDFTVVAKYRQYYNSAYIVVHLSTSDENIQNSSYNSVYNNATSPITLTNDLGPNLTPLHYRVGYYYQVDVDPPQFNPHWPGASDIYDPILDSNTSEPFGQWELFDQTQPFHFGVSFVDGNTVWNIGGLTGDSSDGVDTISSADSISNQVVKYTISDSGVSSPESQSSWDMPLKSARSGFAKVGSRVYLFYGFTPETIGTEGTPSSGSGWFFSGVAPTKPTDLHTPSENKTLYFYRTK